MAYILILVAFAAIVGLILINRKGNKTPVDKENAKVYTALLNEHIGYYKKLSETEKLRFGLQVEEFLQDVHIEGVKTELTDTDRVMIAASAVIPVFGLGDWKYNDLTNVILYPDTFNMDFQFEGGNRNVLGMVGSGYMNGQMLLSRTALVKGFSLSSGKENAAIHEFVHLIDKSDGATDGIPENLTGNEHTAPWLKMMHQEMRRIQSGKSDINPYGLTSEAEFLAVAAEYFFEKPEQFKQKHPDLYQQLSEVFKQKPAAR